MRTADELERLAYLNNDRGALALLHAHEDEAGQEQVSVAQSRLNEAIGCYPDEGFLSRHLIDLQALSKRLRGENREELLRIVAALEEDESAAVREGEYGRAELRKAQDELSGGQQ